MAEVHGIGSNRADMREVLRRLDKKTGEGMSGFAIHWENEEGMHFETAGEMTLSRLISSELAVVAACIEQLLSRLEIEEDDD